MQHQTKGIVFGFCGLALPFSESLWSLCNGFVREKLTHPFTGRKQLFAHLEEWCSRTPLATATADHRCALIEGEPGIGKSTVLCYLISLAPKPLQATKLTAESKPNPQPSAVSM
jgi:hypothetical protein